MKLRLALILCLSLASQLLFALSIQKVSFENTVSLPEAELIRASGLKPGDEYSPELIEKALQELNQYLKNQGEYYVQTPYPELIPISDTGIGLQFRLDKLAAASQTQYHIQGIRHFSESSLKKLIALQDESYPLGALPGFMERILALYQERGYLFVKVELDSLVLDSGLNAYIGVDEGKIFQPKNYYFRGNKSTREATILKNSGLAKEKQITPEKLKQAEQNLINKSYIQNAAVIPLDDESLLFEVSEGKMTFLEFVIGINSESDRARLTGMANINFRNLWGTDRGIKLYWRNTPAALSELSFAYHESGHPALPLEADIELFRSEQDSTWVQSRIGSDLYYRSLYHKLGLGLTQNSVWPGAQSSAIIKEDYWAFSAFWSFQNVRELEALPKGSAGGFSYQYQLRKDKDNSSLEAVYQHYQPLKGKLGSHLRAVLKGYTHAPDAEYELYHLGGFNSLRGYREDEYSSWRLGWLNAELRYAFQPRFWGYLFYDQGILLQKEDSYKADLFALGGGISFQTRLGILSIGYGLPYRDKRFSSIGLGAIHLGLDFAL